MVYNQRAKLTVQVGKCSSRLRIPSGGIWRFDGFGHLFL